MVDTIEALSAARTVEQIADVVRTQARKLSGADGVAVVLRDEDRCHYVDEDTIAPLWKGRKFPMTTCISGWAMLNGKTAVIPDIYLDPRIPHDAYRPTFVKSLVMTPVRPSDLVAAIGPYWAEERTPKLATNAAKYGALSVPDGKVELRWSIDLREPRAFTVSWRETGGPMVELPKVRGMGSQLVLRGLPHAVGGTAHLDFDPEGVIFELTGPISGRVEIL